MIRAYLSARWQGTRRLSELDDAAQEVFVDCFRDRGALERFERERPGGFRAFLYGVTRLVALRFERSAARRRAPVRANLDFDRLEADVPSLSKGFDRAWAMALPREARHLQAKRAEDDGEETVRGVELLRLRIMEGRPIRDHLESVQQRARRAEIVAAKARVRLIAGLVLALTMLPQPSSTYCQVRLRRLQSQASPTQDSATSRYDGR